MTDKDPEEMTARGSEEGNRQIAAIRRQDPQSDRTRPATRHTVVVSIT